MNAKNKAAALLLLSGLVLGIMGLSTPLPAARAAPDAVHLNQTTAYFDPVADAYVSQVAPTTNFGSATKLDVQNLDGGEFPDDRRSYVGFDLSTIPGEAIISSAAFKAYLYDAQGLSDANIQLRQVTSAWAENSATWNKRPTSSAYTEISVGTTTGMKGWDVTSLVQDYWINRNFGASPNFGLELRGPESGDYYLRRFYSADAKADKPYLAVTYDLPTPTPTHSPPTKPPTETPTATPTSTSPSTLTTTPTPTPLPGEPPDLAITDVWSEDGDICYQVRNIGDAVALKGHYTALSIDGQQTATDLVNIELAAGERLNRCFGVGWQCSPPKDVIDVCTDLQDAVVESNETNNCTEEAWLCDTTPPEITSDPTVSQIGQMSATISWTTDEDSDSLVQFGSKARGYEDQKSDATLVKDHKVVLTGLKPATTYHFVVQSADASDNTVVSAERYFQTEVPADGIAPDISFFAATGKYLPMEFTASATDNVEVHRVEFSFDEQLMGIDYSAPYQSYLDPIYLNLDPEDFFGSHTLQAAAFDFSDKHCVMSIDWDAIRTCNSTGMSLEILRPYYGYRICTDGDTAPAGEVLLEVEAKERLGFDMDLPGGERWAVVEPVEFFMDGGPITTTYIGGIGSSLPRQYSWDPEGLSVGWHELSAQALTSDGCRIEDFVEILVSGPPDIEVARTVTRYGNYFGVELELTNVGTGPAYVTRTVDSLVGFQTTMPPDGPDTLLRYQPADRQSSIEIFPRDGWDYTALLEPGETATFVYHAVPILYVGREDYSIGGSGCIDYYDREGRSYYEDIPLTSWWVEIPGESDPVPLYEAVNDAFGTSDYLLVTNPHNLFALYDEEEVNRLLVKTAELATLRNGVLGYYHGYHTLRSGFNEGDPIAISGRFFWGDLTNDEIFLADVGSDLLRSYGATGELHLSGRLPIAHDLHSGDALALGNVLGTNSRDERHHTRHEIIIADSASGQVHVYQYDYVPGSYDFTYWPFDAVYHTGDGFAVGEVNAYWSGSEEEILIAYSDGTGTVEIYHRDDYLPIDSFTSQFEAGDGFAVGEVLGNSGLEEIIVADVSMNIICMYVSRGGGSGYTREYSISLLELAPEDGLAVGDVYGDEKEEIVIADESEDRIYVYGYTPGYAPEDSFQLISDLSFFFQPQDSLAVADVFRWGKAEILVARGRSSGGHNEGDIEMLSYAVGETPGDRHALDALISEGGAWTEVMSDTWTLKGYLLIVGETEIIPAFSANWDLDDQYGRVDYTDRQYASTTGDSNYPELSIGRIIGNNAERLQKPIQASIDVVRGDHSFDNSDAYAVSGYNCGPSGGAADIDFTDGRDTVADTLRGEGFSVLEEHTPNEAEFFSHAWDKDVVYLAGHGNWDVWDVIDTYEVRAFFAPGDARPLVYAASCLTGRYPRGTSLAEEFLNQSASAYVGATEVSFSPYGKRLANNLFVRLDPFHTIGSALKHAKFYRVGAGASTYSSDRKYNRYVCAVFHLYGDPKLEPTWLPASAAEGQLTRSPSAETLSLTGPLSSVEVTVPDYEVTTMDGNDYVEIPGGGIVLVPYKPIVPSFNVLVGYQKGYQIQDVTLIQRSGLVTDTGLNIPDVVPAITGEGGSKARQAPEGSEWWPDSDFAWTTIQGPSDTMTLAITIYPFHYYPSTTNVRFYKNYTFTVQYATSTVEIREFVVARPAYEQGQAVGADVYLLNSAEDPVDVIVDVTVKSETLAETVDGLPLRTLKDVRGLASFSVEWDSTGFETGDYSLEIAIRDTDGTLLDKETQVFVLGISAGAITDLTATPESFDVGDSIATSLTFENVGTMNITGTAFIKVRDETGGTIQEFEHTVPDSTPGNSISFDDVWDTSGVQEGFYGIVGYVLYDGKSTSTVTAVVSTARPEVDVYLPSVLKSYP